MVKNTKNAKLLAKVRQLEGCYDGNKFSLEVLRSMERDGYAEYYKSKYGEDVERTIDTAKKGDDNAIIQLIEWDKLFLSEPYVIARIKSSEMSVVEFFGAKYSGASEARKSSRRFLERVSASITKTSQLPKIKKHWGLLRFLKTHSEGLSMDELVDFARSNRDSFKVGSLEEDFLANKRAMVARFVETHKHFLGLS